MSDVPAILADIEARASAVRTYARRFDFHSELEQLHRFREDADAADQEHAAAVACLRAWQRNVDGTGPDKWERSPVTPYYIGQPPRNYGQERG